MGEVGADGDWDVDGDVNWNNDVDRIGDWNDKGDVDGEDDGDGDANDKMGMLIELWELLFTEMTDNVYVDRDVNGESDGDDVAGKNYGDGEVDWEDDGNGDADDEMGMLIEMGVVDRDGFDRNDRQCWQKCW